MWRYLMFWKKNSLLFFKLLDKLEIFSCAEFLWPGAGTVDMSVTSDLEFPSCSCISKLFRLAASRCFHPCQQSFPRTSPALRAGKPW